MHNEFQDIENALRSLTPRAPSDFCRARIDAEIDAGTRDKIVPFARRGIFYFAGTAAAACLALVFIFPKNDSAPTNTPAVASAIHAPANTLQLAENRTSSGTNVHRTLSSIEPLDIRQSQDGRYFRPIRVQYVDTQEWPNAGAGATLIKSTPAEEVRFVPVDVI